MTISCWYPDHLDNDRLPVGHPVDYRRGWVGRLRRNRYVRRSSYPFSRGGGIRRSIAVQSSGFYHHSSSTSTSTSDIINTTTSTSTESSSSTIASSDSSNSFSNIHPLTSTSIPSQAYIHLNQQLRPYKQHIPSDSHLNLQLIKTIESLDYVPSNRNLAIKQTISHYYTHHLPNYLLNQLSRWITEPGIRSLRSTGRLILSSRIKRTDPSVDLGSVSMAGCPSNLSFESQKSSSSRFSSELSNRASDSQSGSGFNSLTGNVVILGGFRGSVLESVPQRTGLKSYRPSKVVWPNLQEAIIRDSDPDLAMCLSGDCCYEGRQDPDGSEDESRVKDLSNGVRPSRMLDRVSLTPFLPPVLDMGYTLRRRLERIDQRRLDGHRYLARNQSGAEKHFEPERLRVFQWGYDFRADLDELGDQLIDYLTELRSRNESHSSVGEEGSGATVLAHSMGGLVVLNAVSKAKDASIFKQVIFLGTPFKGCPGIYSPFRYGDGFFRQVNICNPITSSSWPSAFHLLPPKTVFMTTDGRPIELDLSDPKTWDVYGLSPLAAGVSKLGANVQSVHQKQEQQRIADLFEPACEGLSMGGDSIGIAPAGRLTGPPLSDSDLTIINPQRRKSDKRASSRPTSKLHPTNAQPELIRQHFKRCYRRSQKFHRDLSEPIFTGTEKVGTMEEKKKVFKKYPPMAIVASHEVRTVKGMIMKDDTPEGFIKEGYKKLIYDWGDGVILWESAIGIPGEWGKLVTKIVESKFGHMALLSDHDSIEIALKSLQQQHQQL